MEKCPLAVVDDQLILKADRGVLYKRNEPRAKRRALDARLEFALLHAYLGPSKFLHRGLDNLYCTHACRACGAELRIILNPRYNSEYGEVRYTARRNLGRCSKPDKTWRKTFSRDDLCDSLRYDSLEWEMCLLPFLWTCPSCPTWNNLMVRRLPDKTPGLT